MFFLLTTFLSQFILQSLAFVIPQHFSQDNSNDNANYYLIPVQELLEPGDLGGDNIDSINTDTGNNPTGEEIIEALLEQLEYPQDSESIYNSLINVNKKDEESLSHQLSGLKSENPETLHNSIISDRKFFHNSADEENPDVLRRRKRSIPPFINIEKINRQ